MLTGRTYESILSDQVKTSESVLDLGCGRNSPIKRVPEIGYSVGVDGYRPYLLQSKREKAHGDYVLASLNHQCFRPRSFQTVVLLDVLEHLTKSDGYKIIEEMEKLATDKVVLFTPNGFLNQEDYEGNILQTHLSGWTAPELEKRGFKVYGVNGAKFFRKEKAQLRINQRWFYELCFLSEKLVFRFPTLAFQLLAVKKA